MPTSPITLEPGVNTEQTFSLRSAGIVQASQIRFRASLPEKLGGWSKFYPLKYALPPRDMHAWKGINNDLHLFVGGDFGASIITQGIGIDITPEITVTNPPVRVSTTSTSAVVTIIDNAFTPTTFDIIDIQTPIAVGGLLLSGTYQITSIITTGTFQINAGVAANTTVTNGGSVPVFTSQVGSPTITVGLTKHGYTIGEFFNIAVPTNVGGLTLSGAYLIQAVPDANNFRINASLLATSTATVSENGGNARYEYFIGVGPPPAGGGYGLGPYGAGAYGTGTVIPSSGGTPITATDWTSDNWGEIVLFAPANGAIYSWSPDSGFTIGVVVVGAPLISGGIFIAEPEQILVSWGSSTGDVQDPLLVRWSDVSNYTDFVATTDNQAGSFRLSNGSNIIGGITTPSQQLIWTDVGVWSMQYVGVPYIFGFNNLGQGCGAISSHAMGVLGSGVYWMGLSSFYGLAGGEVSNIPCDVWDVIFQNLDTDNAFKIRCLVNSGFDEVGWAFPSLTGGGEIDSYIKVNLATPGQPLWDYAIGTQMKRSAWIDQNVFGQPLGGSVDGFIFQHEIAADADGQALVASFTTGFFALSESEDYVFIDMMTPDFKYKYFNGTAQNAQIQITFLYCDYPGGTIRTDGPYAVTNTTDYINPRLRGRLVAFQVESTDVGSWWRLGKVRFRFAPDGQGSGSGG